MDDIPDMDDETDGFGGVEEEEDEATAPYVSRLISFVSSRSRLRADLECYARFTSVRLLLLHWADGRTFFQSGLTT